MIIAREDELEELECLGKEVNESYYCIETIESKCIKQVKTPKTS